MVLNRTFLLFAVLGVGAVVVLGGRGDDSDATPAAVEADPCSIQDPSLLERLFADSKACLEELMGDGDDAAMKRVLLAYDGLGWKAGDSLASTESEQGHEVYLAGTEPFSFEVRSEAGALLYKGTGAVDQGTMVVLDYLDGDGVESVTFTHGDGTKHALALG